jgi:hypothetical protein
LERRERGARWFCYRAREAKRDEDIGFKFSVDFIWVGLISILVFFFLIIIQVGLIFGVGLILNGYMVYHVIF